MNKRLSILFIFMLLFQSISGGLVFAEGAKGSSGDSIFTDVQLTDSENNPVSDEQSPETVNVHIAWTLENIAIEDVKDTYTLSLPEQLQIEGKQQGDVIYEDNTLGSYELSVEGVLTVLLNDIHEEYEHASGEIVIDHVPMRQAQESEQDPNEKSGTSDDKTEDETSVSKKEASEDEGQSNDDQSEADSSSSDKREESNQINIDKNQEKGEKEQKPTEEKKSKNDSEAKKDKERTIGTFAEIQENIFTFKSLTYDGEEIADGSIIDIGDGTKVEIEFKWDTEGLDVKSGDTASMQLPDVFEQVSTPEKNIVTSGITVGTYSIQDGELKFVFNDKIEDGDVSNGKVGLNLDFNLQKFEEDIEQVIDFNDSEETTLNVVAKPNKTASSITKEGHPDQKHNASEITWTVDVINNSEETVTDATLNDSLPDGLGLPENLVVKSLSTDLDGNKVVGDEVNTYSGNITDGIKFDELKPFKGYRVEYTTPITDKDKTEFTNDASFYNGIKDLPASATVDGLTTSNPIEKSGKYNDETGQIDWTIVANENGTDINNVIIEDELPDALTLVKETLKVNKYVDGSQSEVIEIGPANFPIELGETAANEHYEIKFSTDIDYTAVNEGNYQKTNSFTNTTTLKDGKDELGDDGATVDFDREPLLEKAGKSNVDYDNKTLSWTIDVNKAKHPFGDLTITDTIPDGLSLAEDDIEITDEDGNDFPAESIDIDQKEVTINLSDVGTKHLTIEYTTDIEKFDVDNFKNTVSIGGDGIGEGDHDTGHEITPPGNSFDKNFEGIDYNKKTMDWSLKVDPKREAITDLEITDTFPNQGMILDDDSVEVNHSNQDKSLVKGTDYTLEPIGEGYQKGFTIKLIGDFSSLDKGYLTVDYTTSYDPEFEVGGNTLDPHVNTEGNEQVYVNKANYQGTTENGNGFNEDREADTIVREDSWNSGKKEGKLVNVDSDGNLEDGWQSGSERKIAWQLYTNYQKQNLGDNVEITDTLDYKGEIDEDSIKVSTYDVDSGGKTTINEDDVLDSSKYTVNVTGDEFTLTFDETVEKRYVVEFLTTVPDISQERYTNKATVKVGSDEYPYSGTVDYKEYDHFLDKSAIGQEGSDVYIGDEIDWEVNVNDSLSVIENPEIIDTISAGLEYVEGTLEVSTKDGKSLSEGTDYTLTKTTTEAGETVLTIELKETLDQALTLNYTTVVTAEDGDTVNNKISLNGENIETETITSEELTAEQFSWVEGEFNENRGALQITKVDSETGDPIANNPATFELYYNLNGERVQFGDQYQTDENGQLLIGNLPLRTYYVKEVEAPTGYIIDGTEQEIDVTDPYGSEENVYEMEFTNTVEKTDISVTKEWEDAHDQDGARPDSVDVQLLADNEPIGVSEELSEKNDWTHEWKNLDEYQSNGDKINYTVEEVDVPEGYKSQIDKADDSNITITNTYEPKTIDVLVSKKWDDAEDQDGFRPNNVTVNLLNGSEVVREVKLNKDNGWQHTFADLPKFADGVEIDYSVTEDSVGHYSTDIVTTNTEEGLSSVITNSYTPEKTTATVTKVWKDGENQDGNRPKTVTVQLLADGNPHGDPVEVSATDSWTYTWKGLDLKSDGEPIEYTVEEKGVSEEYEVSLDNKDHGNLVITNAYEPETTEISVAKSWDDNSNQDGVRPDNVTVNLLADGEVERTTVLNAEKGWKHTFTDLPVNENGDKIKYTVTENNVPEYSSSIEVDPESENGYVVTNTHTPAETSATVTKDWNDERNQDGKRPESIEVQLTADGEPVGETVTLSKKDKWSHTWNGLDLYADGKEIDYSVKELDVPEKYTVTVNDKNHGNIIITNSYIPERTEVPVIKIWDDADDQDGERPAHIKLNLLNDRGEIVKSAVVQEQEGNEWEYTFTDIPKYEKGKEINYRVTEDFVSDYSTTIEENPEAENGFVVKNAYTPEKTSVTVTKGWNDEENQDGKRPESIDVQLTADGEPVGEAVTLSKAENWTHTWSELDQYADGEEIDYSVEELDVPEAYTVTINDKNHGNIMITNSYTPEKTEVPVTKTWKDDDNQDGTRSKAITVNLLANSKIVDTVVVTKTDNWKYTFTNLSKYEAGEEIEYTITENAVEGYDTTIGGYNIVNLRVGETEVMGEKTWLDDTSEVRPDTITVNLLQNGEKISTKEVTAEDDWAYSFTDLEKFDEQGVEYEYTVEEKPVDGYKTTINGFDITNTRVGLTDLEVSKTWKGDTSEDRPDAITVDLLQNGEVIKTVDITSDMDWTHTFTELDQYDDQGGAYVYSVQEHEVKGYTSMTEEVDGGFEITNTLDVTPPEPEDPKDPQDPEDPNDPGDPGSPTDPSDPNDPNQPDNTLPKTATNMFNLLIIGLLLAASGITLMAYRKRREA
ncbi:Pheromone-processing carboxypeptidase KEX1 [Lentibacillus sp. JNUCC-1]|uniref:Cna B-type domain-containing protein n=1 Tax=Lentibacillus sp. JNUCC-1 TaxID=2654513 RepID=UPI001326157B|nr:Cna B-type domain-containing protein [Lentibacillus sp. JNUCC-1]MUV38128.1 Pheromone-processing carboxypeptidase KEX1 [Lentibacillus sp. JNUCC-1]